MLGWTTKLTYKAAPPFPDRIIGQDGTVLMSAADIEAGKAGFQKADLMDYGSLYGMGSYFGRTTPASNLVRLANLTEDNIARASRQGAVGAFTEDRRAIKAAMQAELQGVDLTQQVATSPTPAARDPARCAARSCQSLLHHDFARAGRRPTASIARAPRRPRIS